MRRPCVWPLTLALLWPSAALAELAPFRGLSHRDRLYDLSLRGAVVLAVGYPGIVLRSVDGGQAFTQVAVPTREALFAVDANERGLVVAVGRAGTLLMSTDAGAHWTLGNAFASAAEPEPAAKPEPGAAAAAASPSPVSERAGADGVDEAAPSISDLFDVAILDNDHIVATGEYGTILVSEDVGKSWQRRAYTTDLPGAAVAAPVGSGRAPTAAGGAPSSVEDGDRVAQSWSDPNELSAEEANAGAADEAVLSSVAFIDEQRGFIVGEFGLVLASGDGGGSWHRVRSPTSVQLFGIAAGANHLVAVGRDGVLIESQDAGVSWQLTPTPTKEHLFGVWAEGSRVVAVGARGSLLTRERAGSPFEFQALARTALTAARFEGLLGFVVGMRGHLIVTHDGTRFERMSGN